MVKRHLLDEIAYRSEKSISDFRFDENIVLFRKCVEELNPNDFTLDEWSEAIHYIYSDSKIFTSVKEVLNYLEIEG